MAGINPDLFKDEFHFQIEQFWLGKHISCDTENTVLWAEVDASIHQVIPLL